ncbi:MAG: hypothetical protein KME14_26130 [Tildeniella torsiva UHER 1998/13D]|jgi:hypothetical protein|nr:hypothetical protein [Tildeniella torsiva UHER 1998/13D]
MTAILVHTDRPAAVATRWFHVVTIHTEMLYTAAGEPMGERKLIEGINIEVESGGWFGWGEQAAIESYVAEHHPGHEVVDTWPIARPIAA